MLETRKPEWAAGMSIPMESCHVVKLGDGKPGQDHGVLCESWQTLVAVGTHEECAKFIGEHVCQEDPIEGVCCICGAEMGGEDW